MMQSISHWGQFEMQAPGTDCEQIAPQRTINVIVSHSHWPAYRQPESDKSIDYQYDSHYLHGNK